MTLRAQIEALAETQRLMGKAALNAQAGPNGKAELVAMRRRFSLQVGEVANAIDGDAGLRAKPELLQEFRACFSAMRSMIAIHQATFPAVLLDAHSVDFRTSADAVIQGNRAFLAWAQSILE